jgi:autotransporter-associated beta strand protein
VNAGVYTFAGPGRIVDGSVIVDSGGELVLANSGNSYAGTTSVFNGTLRITGDANAMVSPVTVAFGGTLVLDPTDAAGMASAFTVQPGGVMEIGTPATDANVLPDNPASIVDDGVIRIYDSELIRNVSGAGQIILAGETSQFAANSTFAGQTSVSAGAAIEVQDDEALGTSQASAMVEDGGVVEVNLPAQLPVNITLNGAGTGNGALRVGPSTLASFDGHIGLAAASTIQVQSDAIARFNGAVDSSSDGNLTVDVQSGGQAVFGGAVSLASGGLVKTGGGQAQLLGNYSATGMTEVQAGTLEVGAAGQLVGEFKVASGAELHVANPDAFASTAKLTGNGTIVGSLNYSGVVAPGGAIGALTLAGDLSLSAQSVVQLELSGLAPTIEYDQLRITAASALDGTLEVLLADGFMPGPGDSFALLTAGGVTGQFATALLPVLNPGLTWDLNYLTNEVLLSVSAVPVFAPADFNVDGSVDGTDLAVWQGSFGLEPAAHAQGDADGDGIISGADFLVWQWQLAGLTAMATSAAVPEPDRWALLASSSLALAGLIHFHRQRT